MTDTYIFTGYLVRNKETGAIGQVSLYNGEPSEFTPEEFQETMEAVRDVIARTDDFEIVTSIGGDGAAQASANYGLEPRRNHVRFKIVDIDAVVRRKQRNYDDKNERLPDTPVIDLYAPWTYYESKGVWYGRWKELPVWLNSEEEVAAFERYSGVKLDDLPVLNGQSSLQRDREPIINEDGTMTVFRDEDVEVELPEPIKVIVRIENVWDSERQELKIKRNQQGEPILRNGQPQLIERTVFGKWYGEWLEEIGRTDDDGDDE